MIKDEELKKLAEKIKNDLNLPLRAEATNLVFGEGDPNSKLLLIGEAPGFHEDRLGRPFVGNAGNLLDKLLNLAHLKREEVYITNIVKYRPPENRDPMPSEIKAFEAYLFGQLEIINPEFIITLGRYSLNCFLPKAKITQVHGQAYGVGGRIVVPMFHPAAALRNPALMDQEVADFKKLPQILENPHSFLQNKKNITDESQMSLF